MKDLTGQRFGRLTVIQREGNCKWGSIMWLCHCDCGGEKIVSGATLRDGRTQSCGCLRKERVSETHRTHRSRRSRLYYIWNLMIQRCTNPNNGSFPYYGGRGITVCEEWRTDFGAFRDWAMANGYDETVPRGQCTIDRINNDGNYEPANCRWVDMKIQATNRRNNNNQNNQVITYNQKTQTLAQWAKEYGINKNTIRLRLRRGWSIEKAVTTPKKR